MQGHISLIQAGPIVLVIVCDAHVPPVVLHLALGLGPLLTCQIWCDCEAVFVAVLIFCSLFVHSQIFSKSKTWVMGHRHGVQLLLTILPIGLHLGEQCVLGVNAHPCGALRPLLHQDGSLPGRWSRTELVNGIHTFKLLFDFCNVGVVGVDRGAWEVEPFADE